MARATIQRVATPTAILVGLSDELATLCIDVLGDGGLRVLRVGHIAGASERIPVVMPQLVVISTSFRPEELASIDERCLAVGAEILRVRPEADRAELRRTLDAAASTAMVKALRGA